MNRRGQAAIEFLLLFGFMILVFTVFALLMQQRTSSREEESARVELARIGDTIAAEVSLAMRVHDGYARTFRIPLSTSHGAYAIDLAPAILPSEITISDGEAEYVVFLPINLTTGTSIEPGVNHISRDDGVITITSVAPTAISCDSEADCASGFACEDGICVERICAVGLDDAIWVAGGSSLAAATAGTVWTQRLDGGVASACCDENMYCAVNASISAGCAAYGFVSFPGATNRAWVCGNMTAYGGTPVGPDLFRCTSTNDGKLISNPSSAYCCSLFTVGANSGTYGFNLGFSGNADKAENLSIGGSCSDASDNDCDGKRDGYDDSCWSAIISSSCGSDTTGENLTAYPNSTMHGSGAHATRFTYDWRVGGVSLATHQYTFDVNSTPSGSTPDSSSFLANMTTIPAKNQDPTWVLSDGTAHRGMLVFDGTDDWTNVTAAPPTGAYSVEVWVRPDDAAVNRNIIVLTSAAGPATAYSHQIRMTRVGGFIDQYRFIHYLWDGAAHTVTDTQTFVPGGWHHVVATATPGGSMSLYVDGVSVGTPATIGTPWGAGTQWQIGPATGGGFNAYNGAIDEVRIYHRALSATQIASLYARGYDRINAQELTVGEAWTAQIWPSNGTRAGQVITSNGVKILAGVPVCAVCACTQPDLTCATAGQYYQGNACKVCSVAGWSNVANGVSCGDGLACNGVDTCQSGTCTAGAVIACDVSLPYCIEPTGACVECSEDSHCEGRCAVETTKGGTEVLYYPSSSCVGNACEAVTSERCYSGVSEPADVSEWCHGATDKAPIGCCGSAPDFLCPPAAE